MGKIKLTKGELKRQRDALARYERYLPILQLKKQQLQIEIVREVSILGERRAKELEKTRSIEYWAGLFSDEKVDLAGWVRPDEILKKTKNVAGVDIPVFEQVKFAKAEYDLFLTPLWVDAAIEALRSLAVLREDIKVIEEGVRILRQELRVTTQRVNLFEKVKIPQAQETIRLIKIYIGDQMTNAVGRSKIAKRKIGEAQDHQQQEVFA